MAADEEDTGAGAGAGAGAACVRSVCVLGSVFNTSFGGGRIVDTETADIVDESEDEDDAEVNFFFGAGAGGGAATTADFLSSGLRLEADPEFESVRRPTRSRPRSTRRPTPRVSRSRSRPAA